MKRKLSRQIYVFFSISLLLHSCTNKKEIDISKIDVTIKIERFDRDFLALSPQNISVKAPQLHKKYGFFYEDFMQNMIGVGSAADTGYYNSLKTVLLNKDYQALKSDVELKYPDMDKETQDLTVAFKHIRYYYPKQKFPRIITFFSGFSVQTPIGNDYIGIGLDMFLGADSKFYPALRQSIPEYIARRFTPENITPRVIEGLAREELFPESDKDRSLLSKMIYNGKILYFLDAVIPDLPDSLKIGYSSQQMQWSTTFEPEIWAYFLQNDLLYESDYMKIQKYLADAPFTPGIGDNSESAPKLGVYTGWQIVKKYMEKNPEITLQQLMKESDPQRILNGSKYKPR
jgi:gliding motility-associated lipoprotein GldB